VPIPNTAVKPPSGDGTRKGRVANRQLFARVFRYLLASDFVYTVRMSWASGRQLLILGILILLLALIVGGSAYLSLHKAPSCTDNRQNGGETGVDCGGPCARACAADSLDPVVSYARALRLSPSRTDLIASVENPNRGLAAKGAEYFVTFHDARGTTV